jgi:hypothetical protein
VVVMPVAPVAQQQCNQQHDHAAEENTGSEKWTLTSASTPQCTREAEHTLDASDENVSPTGGQRFVQPPREELLGGRTGGTRHRHCRFARQFDGPLLRGIDQCFDVVACNSVKVMAGIR